MDFDQTLFGYAIDALQKASSVMNTLLIFSATVIYIMLFGSRKQHQKLQSYKNQKNTLTTLKTNLKVLGDLRDYYDASSDIKTPKKQTFFTSMNTLAYAEERLLKRLSLPDAKELAVTEPLFYRQVVQLILNKIFMVKAEKSRLLNLRKAGEPFDALTTADIRDLGHHDSLAVAALYNEASAVIEALDNAKPSTGTLEQIFRRRRDELSNNLKDVTPQTPLFTATHDTALATMTAQGFRTLAEVTASQKEVTDKLEELQEELDKSITLPVIGSTVALDVLSWLVPVSLLLGGLLLGYYLQHAQVLIRNLNTTNPAFATTYQQYPWYLLKGSSSSLLFFVRVALTLALPLTASIMVFYKRRKDTTKPVLTFIMNALLLVCYAWLIHLLV